MRWIGGAVVYALELNEGGIANLYGKMHAEEHDYDMLEPSYDEYHKESGEIDVYSIQGESLVVHSRRTRRG